MSADERTIEGKSVPNNHPGFLIIYCVDHLNFKLLSAFCNHEYQHYFFVVKLSMLHTH